MSAIVFFLRLMACGVLAIIFVIAVLEALKSVYDSIFWRCTTSQSFYTLRMVFGVIAITSIGLIVYIAPMLLESDCVAIVVGTFGISLVFFVCLARFFSKNFFHG